VRGEGKEVRATATTPTRTTMPAGNNNPRLDAVLRAGHAKFAPTGKDAPKGALKGKEAADALVAAKPKIAAPPVMKMKGGGAKPAKKDSNSLVPASATSSEWMKDLVNSFGSERDARKKELEKARELAHQCAEMRIKAINEAMTEQEKATTKVVTTLTDKLKEVQAQLDKLQATEASSSDQKSKCEAAKKSVEEELETFKARCNKERDEAKSAAELKLRDTVAEWTQKLKECEAKSATSGADASKKLQQTIDELTAAKAALKKEQETNSKHLEATKAKNEQFAKAIEEACKLLKDTLK